MVPSKIQTAKVIPRHRDVTVIEVGLSLIGLHNLAQNFSILIIAVQNALSFCLVACELLFVYYTESK
jgi:hypothetical protein